MNRRKILAVCLAATLSILCIGVPKRAYAERLCGNNRYQTSIKISQKGWKSSKYVILASGSSFADALCAVPLAKAKDAPVILSGKDNLNPETVAEIKRLGATYVYIAGGIGVVSDNVVSQLENELNIKPENIKRLSGNNRFSTSVAVANEMGVKNKLVIAYGYNYADALSIAAVAAIKGMPILLADNNNLPNEDINFINQEKGTIKGIYVVGGSGVINESVKNQIDGLSGINSVRLAGSNRYETNINVLKEFQNDKDINFRNLYIAVGDGPNGDEFADALSGAALAAQNGSSVILAYQNLSDVTKKFLTENLNKQTVVTVLGGEAVMPNSIVSALNNIVSNSNNNRNGNSTSTSSGGSNSISTPSSGSTTGGNSIKDTDPNYSKPFVKLNDVDSVNTTSLVYNATAGGNFSLNNKLEITCQSDYETTKESVEVGKDNSNKFKVSFNIPQHKDGAEMVPLVDYYGDVGTAGVDKTGMDQTHDFYIRVTDLAGNTSIDSMHTSIIKEIWNKLPYTPEAMPIIQSGLARCIPGFYKADTIDGGTKNFADGQSLPITVFYKVIKKEDFNPEDYKSHVSDTAMVYYNTSDGYTVIFRCFDVYDDPGHPVIIVN